jgi:predicted transposase/invertase (TIGR01784 family)
MDCARDEGFEEGVENGMKRGVIIGRDEGINLRNFEIAENLLKLQIPVSDIAKATGLSPEQILSL